MTNIHNNLLLNAFWCVFFLLALIVFICLVRKKNVRSSICGALLLSIRICYHAVLTCSYYRMIDGTHSDVINWHKFTIVASGIQELLTATTIFVILIHHLKKMTKMQ